MASQAQIEANRSNSQKSTGPKSPKGKRKVSQNPIRHGLLTAATLVAGEDPTKFQEFAEAFETTFSRRQPWRKSSSPASSIACGGYNA
jgi:hypothetical protein